MSTCGCRVYTLNFLAIFSFVFPTAEPLDKNNDANTVHVKIWLAYLLGSLALLFTHWEKWHWPLRPHHLCTLLEHWDSVTTISIRNSAEIIRANDSFMAWWELINVIQSVINSFSLKKYCKEFTGALANILWAIHILNRAKKNIWFVRHNLKRFEHVFQRHWLYSQWHYVMTEAVCHAVTSWGFPEIEVHQDVWVVGTGHGRPRIGFGPYVRNRPGQTQDRKLSWQLPVKPKK